VDHAIGWAVKEGKLWLTHGPTSLCSEGVPAGLLTDDACLQPPPSPVPATDVLPANLPEAWDGETSTAQTIADALSAKAGKPWPWVSVRGALDGAFQGRLLEKTADAGPWPCDYAGAARVRLRAPEKKAIVAITPREDDHPQPAPGVLIASAYLKPSEVQDLADQIGEISSAAVGHDLRVIVRIEVGADGKRPPKEVVNKLNAKLGEVSNGFKLA
jgi:hypothetical protein